MADKIIVSKSKVTNLFDSIRAKSGSTDLMSFDTAKESVDGIETIIEVDELPTENIDENAIYKIFDISDVLISIDGVNSYPFALMFEGISSEIIVVNEKPTTDILESSIEKVYLYFVKNDNEVFIYIDFDGNGTTWWTLELFLLYAAGLTLSYKGTISNSNEIVEAGYYALSKPFYYKYETSWIELVIPSGSITIYKSGTHNVSKYENVIVTFAKLPTPTLSLNGTTATVEIPNFGDYNTVMCTVIEKRSGGGSGSSVTPNKTITIDISNIIENLESGGTYTFVARLEGNGFENSDYSNEVTYTKE